MAYEHRAKGVAHLIPEEGHTERPLRWVNPLCLAAHGVVSELRPRPLLQIPPELAVTCLRVAAHS